MPHRQVLATAAGDPAGDTTSLAATASRVRGEQLWVAGKVWNTRRLSRRIPVSVLLDMGAGGGNYVSLVFWESIGAWGGPVGARSLSKKVAGSADIVGPNLASSAVPSMEKVGSTVLPMVFAPEDRVRNVPVRVVWSLPLVLC